MSQESFLINYIKMLSNNYKINLAHAKLLSPFLSTTEEKLFTEINNSNILIPT